MANYCLNKMHPIEFRPEKFNKYNNNLGINNAEKTVEKETEKENKKPVKINKGIY